MSSRSSLSDFEVLSRLGAGSFGTVYKVKRYADDQFYVIKNVRIMELSRKEQSEAINEVQILAQLKSPYVVRYFDSFIERDSLHIGDLQNLIKKAAEKNVSGLKENVVWNMCLQVILGLHYLHKKRILHRDLKTANVFLMKSESSSSYLVKIGDLGVAKLMDTSTALANTIVGTPYYLSPELCKDMPYRDRSDCWALGVLIYECCTLQRPFEAKNQCALIMKIIESHVKIPSSSVISNELSNLILWLLQKDPDRRPCIRDLLCEAHVREKLSENHFEIPEEVLGCDQTNYLRNDFNMYGKLQSEKNRLDAELADSKFVDNDTSNQEKDITNKFLPAKGTETEMENQPKLGKLPSKRINSKQDLAPAIRGDRVRGSSKRILSDKALNRYQMNPLPNQSGIGQGSLNLEIRADSKNEDLNRAKSFKDPNAIDQNVASESKLFPSVQDPSIAKDNFADVKEVFPIEPDVGSATIRLDTNPSKIEMLHNKPYDSFVAHSTLHATDFSSFSQQHGHFSANSTGDIAMDIENDSEFWNTVNMNNRKVGNDVPMPLHPVEESEEIHSPTANQLNPPAELEMEDVESYIQELRTKAIDMLGDSLFYKVYDLVSTYMDSNIDGNDLKNSSFLHELESILCEESQADIEVACEVVFSIKLIHALESKYDILNNNSNPKK